MIEVSQISKYFGEVRALNELSFTVDDGVAFGLLGRNGAGKTTCIRIIMGIFAADKGKILLNGKPITDGDVRIGYLPEERGLYPKRKILEQMIYIGSLRGLGVDDAVKNSKDLLERLDATEYMDRKLETLSKGNQQKIQLAIALLNDPDIVILDEPFSGLDPVNAQILKDIVREEVNKNKTVIFSSHQMSQVEEFCDDICIVNKGEQVLSGNLAQIKRSYPRNKIYVEVEVSDREKFVEDISEKMGAAIKESVILNNGFIFTLADSELRAALYGRITELGALPDTLMIKEPSLEEIFVEKVGNDPNEKEKDEEAYTPKKRGLFQRRVK